MKCRFTVFAVVLLASILSLSNVFAEPDNVLIGNLTFTRPKNWTWQEPPTTSSAVSRFVIQDSQGRATQTDVRFYIMKKAVSTEKAALLHTFPQASAADVHEDETKIGKQKIIYLRITGTYKFRENKPRPDQLWVGAAIPSPSGKEFIYARIQGPRNEAQSYLPIFKQMVENAVRERDLN